MANQLQQERQKQSKKQQTYFFSMMFREILSYRNYSIYQT